MQTGGCFRTLKPQVHLRKLGRSWWTGGCTFIPWSPAAVYCPACCSAAAIVRLAVRISSSSTSNLIRSSRPACRFFVGLTCFSTTIVTYIVTVVIPKFAMLYRDLNVDLPGPTQLLIAVTVDYRYPLLGGVAALFLAALGVYLWSRTENGGAVLDRLKFRLPVIGDALLKFQVAQFSRTLATLLAGGTPLVAGLRTASDALASKLVRGTVLRATQMLPAGESLHSAPAT